MAAETSNRAVDDVPPTGGLLAAATPADRLSTALLDELNPVGVLQTLVAEDLVDRAAQMRTLRTARAGLTAAGEDALSGLLGGQADEVLLAGVVGSERHEAILRQSSAAGRNFYQALQTYRELRHLELAASYTSIDPRFATEQACHAYLVRRICRGLCGCRRCGSRGAGSFIATRLCWQCARCHAQTGLRTGTVMTQSRLPLTAWFAAIRIVLTTPTIAHAELATALRVSRQQTVGNMANRIKEAAASNNASALLAGLDELYLGVVLI